MRDLVAWLVLLALLLPLRAEAADPLADQMGARAAILVNGATGDVLYSRHPDLPLPIASLTKIMTALIAVERGNLDEVITVSEYASSEEGASLYLELGEQQTLRDLLFGLMLESGNDAGTAIAEHIGGTVESFAAIMTRRAAELGARNTQFKNAHGLDDPAHYSTAADMAVIARHAMRNPLFRVLAATEDYSVPGPAREETRAIWNHNQLLYLYDGTTGIKNGWTEIAGFTLAASVKQNGLELIGVLLDTRGRPWWGDAQALFDYGFLRIAREQSLREHTWREDYLPEPRAALPLPTAPDPEEEAPAAIPTAPPAQRVRLLQASLLAVAGAALLSLWAVCKQSERAG